MNQYSLSTLNPEKVFSAPGPKIFLQDYRQNFVEDVDEYVRPVFERPWHPYTQALVAAVPRFAGAAAERLRLKGEPRSPIDPDPNICRFYGRCPIGASDCKSKAPVLRRIGSRHVACHFAEEFIIQRVGPVHGAQTNRQI